MGIQKFGGRISDSPGDNILAELASVVDAVRCDSSSGNKVRVSTAVESGLTAIENAYWI